MNLDRANYIAYAVFLALLFVVLTTITFFTPFEDIFPENAILTRVSKFTRDIYERVESDNEMQLKKQELTKDLGSEVIVDDLFDKVEDIDLVSPSEDGTGRGVIVLDRQLSNVTFEDGCSTNIPYEKICRGTLLGVNLNTQTIVLSLILENGTLDESGNPIFVIEDYKLPSEVVPIAVDDLEESVLDAKGLTYSDVPLEQIEDQIIEFDVLTLFLDSDGENVKSIMIQRINNE